MSVFLAVDLDDAVRARVVEMTTTVSSRFPAKWLPPEKLHVTVLFLGEARPAFEIVDAIAASLPPFELQISGAGTFVTARAPSVLWLGVAGELPALNALHRSAVAALNPHDMKDYVPHLTLARAKLPGFLEPVREELTEFSAGPWKVTGLTLYESTQHRYHALHRSKLKLA
jgi:2'-5' RNA ligase